MFVYFQDGRRSTAVEMVTPVRAPKGDMRVNYVLRGGTDTFFKHSGIACMFHLFMNNSPFLISCEFLLLNIHINQYLRNCKLYDEIVVSMPNIVLLCITITVNNVFLTKM